MTQEETSTNHWPHVVVSVYQPMSFNLSEVSCSSTIYDQSISGFPQLAAIKNASYFRVPNIGHSLHNFTNYISENYEILPDRVAFLKSNIVGRHIDSFSFHRLMQRRILTNLWRESLRSQTHFVESSLEPTEYIQRNVNWYNGSHAEFFKSFESFYQFIFGESPKLDWISFSPGACYLATRENIRNAPVGLWQFLRFISSYKFFPPEAYLVERIFRLCMTTTMPFESRFDTNAWYEELQKEVSASASNLLSLRKRVGFFALGMAHNLRGPV